MFVNFLLKNKVVSCTHELNYDTADWHCSLRTIQCGDFNNFFLISHTFNMFFPQIFLTFLTILTHFTIFFLYYWTLELLNRSKVLFSFTASPKTSLLHLKTESSMTITPDLQQISTLFEDHWLQEQIVSLTSSLLNLIVETIFATLKRLIREGFQKKRIFKDIVLKGGRGSSWKPNFFIVKN